MRGTTLRHGHGLAFDPHRRSGRRRRRRRDRRRATGRSGAVRSATARRPTPPCRLLYPKRCGRSGRSRSARATPRRWSPATACSSTAGRARTRWSRALDLATGRELWRHADATAYTMNPAALKHGKGPKSTPVVADGTRLHARYRRQALLLRGRLRQGAVAARLERTLRRDRARLRHRDVARRLRRPSDRARGRHRFRSAGGLRARDRQGAVALGRRGTRLRVAGARHLRRRRSDRDADPGARGRRRRRDTAGSCGRSSSRPPTCRTS